MRRVCSIIWIALFCLAGTPRAGAADTVKFESLGRPFATRPLSIQAVTTDTQGNATAWGIAEDAERLALVGIDCATGRSRSIDLVPYGRSHVRMIRAANGNLYLYTGSPAHFLRLDARDGKLVDLGVPAKPASYHLGYAVGPDGVFYVGSYPGTHLVAIDPATEKMRSLGPIADDEREKYIVRTAVDGANTTLYATVGLHHSELWAVDLATGAKRQILDDALKANQGSVSVERGADGHVYGKGFGKSWRCHPDRIEYVESVPEPFKPAPMNSFGERQAVKVDEEGKLELRGGSEGKTQVATDFEGISTLIYSVGPELNGKIYGGGFEPSRSFELDRATGKFNDLGQLVTGRIQVYDTVAHPRGLFMGSYTGAHIDFYDFKTKKARHLVSLADECGQERPNQLVQAPDGMIYTVTSPVKGHLEGAIARIDPATLEVKAWAGIVPDQCFMSVVPIAATGELLLTGSTRGGTSALPKATEASLVIWDPKQEKVVWKGEPLKGTTVYAKGAAAKNGLVYIVTAERKYLAFDPVKREMVFSGDLPATGAKASGLKMVDDAAGPDGLIYGLMDDAVFAIDPADHSCRIVGHHPSIARKFEDALHGTLAEWSAADGTLYYGSGSELWRMVPAASR